MTSEQFNNLVGHLVDIADLADAIEERARSLGDSCAPVLMALARHIQLLAGLACEEAETSIIEDHD